MKPWTPSGRGVGLSRGLGGHELQVATQYGNRRNEEEASLDGALVGDHRTVHRLTVPDQKVRNAKRVAIVRPRQPQTSRCDAPAV